MPRLLRLFVKILSESQFDPSPFLKQNFYERMIGKFYDLKLKT